MTVRLLCLAHALLLAMSAGALADEAPVSWPQFHGPSGSGIAASPQAAPVEFGPDHGLLWKTPLPPGHSSPVIWGGRIFLTAFIPAEKRLETLCLDRASGRILWRRPVPAQSIEPVYEVSSPAASSPVTDGKTVVAYFGSFGLVAYDFDGRERWSKPLPMVKTFRKLGSGTSPIAAGDRVLLDVHLEEESYLLAVRIDDGKTIWKAPKPEWNGGWATPIVWREAGEVLVGVLNPGRFTAHSLRDGSERWWVGELPFQTCATPVVGQGVLFLAATGGQGERDNISLPPSFDEMLARFDGDKDGLIAVDEIPDNLLFTERHASKGAGNLTVRRFLTFLAGDRPQTTSYDREKWDDVLKRSTEFVEGPFMQSGVTAIRVGGAGDVTRSHVQWVETRGVPEVPSPLFYKDRLYLVRNGGLVVSRAAATGRIVFEGRLGAPGGYYASPIAADGRIYAASDEGTIVVFEASDSLNVLVRNDLGEPIMATPAIVDGKIYVRTLSNLYAFGPQRTLQR